MTVAIIFGGKSYEHDVSIVTAKQIYSVAKLKYQIKLIYLDKDDKLFEYSNMNFEFADFKTNQNLKPIIFSDGHIYKKGMFGLKVADKIDAAIICCHGGVGENGTLENYLLINKVPVSVGSGFALGVAMNKWQTKTVLKSLKISVVDGVEINSKKSFDENVEKVEARLCYPVIVKPNNGGSSIGIAVAKDREELLTAMKVGFEFDSSCIVEKAIENFDEYNQAILGDKNQCELSCVDKVEHKNDILTFQEKYLSGGEQKGKGMKFQKRTFECDLPQKVFKQLNQYSKTIFEKLGFFGVIRIDYIYDKNNQKLYVNEINAVPGSLAIYFFNNCGSIGFLDKLVDVSIKNCNNNDNFNKNYITNLF